MSGAGNLDALECSNVVAGYKTGDALLEGREGVWWEHSRVVLLLGAASFALLQTQIGCETSQPM